MAILRALDGTFYEVPDDQMAKFKIPPDKLKEKLGSQVPTDAGGPPEGGGGGEPGGASPLVNVQIYYGQGQGGGGGAPAAAEAGVQPYDWRNWRNWANWRNWRNHWD
jgi:hypothetical protein